MKRPTRRIQYKVYDHFTLEPKEKEVYHAIVKETILKNRRCVELPLGNLSAMTNINKSTIPLWVKKLEKRRLIEVDRTQKTHTYCIVTIYKELFRSCM